MMRFTPERMILPLLLAVGVGLLGCAQPSGSLADSYTSHREKVHAREDPDYAARLVRADSLARRVDKDSLRAIYLRILDSKPEERVALWHAVVCETSALMIRYSPAVAARAEQHLLDSLLAQPGVSDRWASGQTVEQHTMTTAGCNLNVPRATDTVGDVPEPNVLR